MGLDYGFTCPDIDRSIESYKQDIEDNFRHALENHSELKDEKILEIAKDYAYGLYQDFEGSFESVRSTNEDLRKHAEYQIDELEKRIENLECQLDDLTDSVASKDREIDSLNEELASATI